MIHVRDHPADDLPVGVTVHIFQGKDLDLPKRLVADIPHDLIGHLVIADIHNPLSQSRDQDHRPHQAQNGKNSRKVHRALGDDMVDGPARQFGQIQSQRHCHPCQKQGNGQIKPIGAHIS